MITAKFVMNNYVKPVFLNTGRKAGNCAYFYKQNKKYLLTRETDYVYGRMPNGTLQMYLENDGSNIVRSDEVIYEKNEDSLKFVKELTKASNVDWGYEDPRSVCWNGQTYLMFSRRKIGNWQKFQLYLCSLSDNLTFENQKVFDGKMLIEKNWQPIEDMPGKCVYGSKPFQLIDLNTNKYIDIKNDFGVVLRGSSNIIKYKENYLGIYHIRNDAFEYLHYFVLFDKDMKFIKMSDPFSFFGANVEFNCYAEYKNEKLIIPVSVHDQLIYEFTLTDSDVNKILNKEMTDDKKNNCVFSMFYNNAKKSNNIFAALVISSFSYDARVLEDAIIINHHQNYFRNNQQKLLQCVLLENFKHATNF